MPRPDFIKHWQEIQDADDSHYPGSRELMSIGSPFGRAFDPLRLPRIQAVESDLASWLGYFEKSPQERFVSDGDPATVTIPAARRDGLRRELPGGLRVVER